MAEEDRSRTPRYHQGHQQRPPGAGGGGLMATLEELTIVVDGDTSGATSSLSNLESTASRSASSTESSPSRVSDGFDTTATRAQGFADTVGGVPDTFKIGRAAGRERVGQHVEIPG